MLLAEYISRAILRLSTRGLHVHSFALPMILSFCFPFFAIFFLSSSGAGNVGFPDPLCVFTSSAAAAFAACDCCITLNSFTTAPRSDGQDLPGRQDEQTYLLSELPSGVLARSRHPILQ